MSVDLNLTTLRLVGAGLAHVLDRRRGLAGAALAGVVATGALVVFFV